jgi:hypothetical protein
MQESQPGNQDHRQNGPSGLLDHPRERLLMWGALGVVAILLVVVLVTQISQAGRIERVERAVWQAQTWTAQSTTTTAAATTGGRGAKGERGSPKAYNERRAQRVRESQLSKLDTFIVEQAVPQQQQAALRAAVETCLDAMDAVRRDGTEEGRRERLMTANSDCQTSIAGLIGAELAQDLELSVFRKPERDGEQRGGGQGAE